MSLTVPDDRAVGGLVRAGDTVDVFVTVSVLVPQDLVPAGKYYTDKSTKITYQNLTVLAKAASFYIVKVTARRGRGDHPPPGERRRHVQLRPPPRPTSGSSTRRSSARPRTHDHPALRPADPADLPDRPARSRARWRRRAPPPDARAAAPAASEPSAAPPDRPRPVLRYRR